jgi:beta-glucosidase
VQGDHYKLIREIGAASTVLLKNTKKALPLKLNKIRKIGIFGSDAGPNPDGPNGCGDRGCDQGTLAMGWGSGTASEYHSCTQRTGRLNRCSDFSYLVDPSTAINAYVQANKPTTDVEAIFSDYKYDAIMNVARYADVCLVFANADSGEAYITVDGNAGDRNNLTLWHEGDTLIATTAALCPNTIVVLHTVGPVLVEAWIDNPNITAVLAAGLPGQETGNALVDVLFGAVNPSGRLPYTIAKQRSDYPADVLYTSSETTPQITYSERLNIDYRHFDANNIAPRFEFGFGLSYTTVSDSSTTLIGAWMDDGFCSSRIPASAFARPSPGVRSRLSYQLHPQCLPPPRPSSLPPSAARSCRLINQSTRRSP